MADCLDSPSDPNGRASMSNGAGEVSFSWFIPIDGDGSRAGQCGRASSGFRLPPPRCGRQLRSRPGITRLRSLPRLPTACSPRMLRWPRPGPRQRPLAAVTTKPLAYASSSPCGPRVHRARLLRKMAAALHQNLQGPQWTSTSCRTGASRIDSECGWASTERLT